MPFNGSGVFAPPAADFPAVSGTLILATHFNNVQNDVATGLSDCVTRDGQSAATANLPMGGFRHTTVSDGVQRNQYASLGQSQDSTALWGGTAGGTANALTITLTPAITAYVAGQAFTFKSGAAANTAAATVAVNGLAAKTIQANGAALVAGDIAIGSYYRIVYDGTNFQLDNATIRGNSSFLDTSFNIFGSVDATKIGRFEVDGLTTGTTRVLTVQDKNLTIAGIDDLSHPCNGRLTLTTGVPVTTSDVTAAETLFFTPYNGNKIDLYNGSVWLTYAFSQLSIDIPDATQMNDVFIFDNAGVPTLELATWTNDTTRATALVFQDGVYCKSGALTRRYLGSFYCTTAGNGQTEDSAANRYVWNYYNRIRRHMVRNEAASSWVYSTASYQQANANTANQLNFIMGVSEDAVEAMVISSALNSTATIRPVQAGIGADSTTVNSANQFHQAMCTSSTFALASARYSGPSAVGKHFLSWLEFGTGTDAQTWQGTNTNFKSGITGTILC